jgi:hypothetical protein
MTTGITLVCLLVQIEATKGEERIRYRHKQRVTLFGPRNFGLLCKAYRWTLSYPQGTWTRFMKLAYIYRFDFSVQLYMY